MRDSHNWIRTGDQIDLIWLLNESATVYRHDHRGNSDQLSSLHLEIKHLPRNVLLFLPVQHIEQTYDLAVHISYLIKKWTDSYLNWPPADSNKFQPSTNPGRHFEVLKSPGGHFIQAWMGDGICWYKNMVALFSAEEPNIMATTHPYM